MPIVIKLYHGDSDLYSVRPDSLAAFEGSERKRRRGKGKGWNRKAGGSIGEKAGKECGGKVRGGRGDMKRNGGEGREEGYWPPLSMTFPRRCVRTCCSQDLRGHSDGRFQVGVERSCAQRKQCAGVRVCQCVLWKTADAT